MGAEQFVIMGTAGHIDHGKTQLVKAITGIDTDRLKEEKERGITIDLGFAYLDLPHGGRLGIIDVPGHERFVRNMLAGATGIDFVLLVIAADEGVMPQTREHLDIVTLLGIERGIVALTKIDMVEPDWLDLVQDDVRAYLQRTPLANAPILPVSSRTGAGLPNLIAAIQSMTRAIPPRVSGALFRLPVDRIFTIKGFGTVVTGTVISGSINEGEMIEIVPRELTAKIRGIEVHDLKVGSAHAGQRSALNLQGISKEDVERGDVIAPPGALSPWTRVEARYDHLPHSPWTLANRTRVRVHIGTQEVIARVTPLDRVEIRPSDSSLIQLFLESPIVALPGDRFVIRSFSPVQTVGGGVILSLTDRKSKRFSEKVIDRLEAIAQGAPEEALTALIQEASITGLSRDAIAVKLPSVGGIPELLGKLVDNGAVTLIGKDGALAVHRTAIEDLQGQIMDQVRAFHQRAPLRLGVSKEEIRTQMARPADPQLLEWCLADLQKQGRLRFQDAYIAAADFAPKFSGEQEAALHRIEHMYRAAGVTPPLLSEATTGIRQPKMAEEIIKFLLETGALVRIEGDLLFHREALVQITDGVRAYLQQHGKIAVGDFKNLFNISRKFAVPLLEYFDRIQLTIRRGNDRVLRSS